MTFQLLILAPLFRPVKQPGGVVTVGEWLTAIGVVPRIAVWSRSMLLTPAVPCLPIHLPSAPTWPGWPGIFPASSRRSRDG